MIVHNLKIKYEYAEKVALGIKTFELRKNDRIFQEGDYIAFNVVDIPHATTYAANHGAAFKDDYDKYKKQHEAALKKLDNTIYKIVYKLDGTPEYGLAEGYCILGIEPVAIASSGIATEEGK